MSSTVWATSESTWLDTSTVRPSAALRPQEVAQPPDALGVQAVGGLVEDEDLGVAEQRRGEREPLAHAHASSLPTRRVAACSSSTSASTSSTREAGSAGQRGERPQVVAPRAAGVEARDLQRRADGARRVVEPPVGAAEDLRLPAVGRASPRTIRSVVVLPAPLGPRKPVIAPGRTSKERSSTAARPS